MEYKTALDLRNIKTAYLSHFSLELQNKIINGEFDSLTIPDAYKIGVILSTIDTLPSKMALVYDYYRGNTYPSDHIYVNEMHVVDGLFTKYKIWDLLNESIETSKLKIALCCDFKRVNVG